MNKFIQLLKKLYNRVITLKQQHFGLVENSMKLMVILLTLLTSLTVKATEIPIAFEIPAYAIQGPLAREENYGNNALMNIKVPFYQGQYSRCLGFFGLNEESIPVISALLNTSQIERVCDNKFHLPNGVIDAYEEGKDLSEYYKNSALALYRIRIRYPALAGYPSYTQDIIYKISDEQPGKDNQVTDNVVLDGLQYYLTERIALKHCGKDKYKPAVWMNEFTGNYSLRTPAFLCKQKKVYADGTVTINGKPINGLSNFNKSGEYVTGKGSFFAVNVVNNDGHGSLIVGQEARVKITKEKESFTATLYKGFTRFTDNFLNSGGAKRETYIRTHYKTKTVTIGIRGTDFKAYRLPPTDDPSWNTTGLSYFGETVKKHVGATLIGVFEGAIYFKNEDGSEAETLGEGTYLALDPEDPDCNNNGKACYIKLEGDEWTPKAQEILQKWGR